MGWRPNGGTLDRRGTGVAAMTEEPIIIEMNIARYGALLAFGLDDEKRSVVTRLLAEAKASLVLAIDIKKQC
jgi:hypothetical protein